MKKSRTWQVVLMIAFLGLIANPTLGLSILLAPGSNPDVNIAPRLIGLGHTVHELDPSSWDASFDYSAYDVVALQYLSGNPADISHLIDSVDAEEIGVVFFRAAGTEATAMALGVIASSLFEYQSTNPFSVVDNSHPITSNLEITNYYLGYGNMTYVVDPGLNTTTLGEGPEGAALVVHNSRRAVATPYYGAYWESDIETEVGLGITDRCLRWAAGEPVPVRQTAWGMVKALYAD